MSSVEITDADFDAYTLPGGGLDTQNATIPERETWKINNSYMLSDKNGKYKTTFTLFNDRYLCLTTETKKSEGKETIIDLAFLDDRMKERKQFPTILFLTSVICFLSAVITYLVFPFYYILPSAFTASAICLIVFGFRSFKYTVQFNTMIGEIPVLNYSLDSSNKDKAIKFFADIKAHVAQSKKRLPEGKRLTPILVSEMRRLCEVGLIDSQQYDTIKSEIFSSKR